MQTKLIHDVFVRHGNVSIESGVNGVVHIKVDEQTLTLTKEEYLALYQIYGHLVEYD